MQSWYDIKLNEGSQPKPALVKLRNLLNTPRFCTICYETALQLQNLDDCPLMQEFDDNHLTLRQIIQELFQDASSSVILSNYLCSTCQVKLVYSYSFIQITRNRASNFEHYITHLYSETVDLLDCTEQNSSCVNAVIVLEELDTKAKSDTLDKFKWNSFKSPIKEKHSEPYKNTIQHYTYMCDYCNKEFCDVKFLKAHLNTCGLCKTKTDVQPKQNQTLTDKNVVFPCPKCEGICRHEKFIEHFAEQKINNIKKVKCLECDFTSVNLKPLIEHIDKKHVDDLADRCELCGKIFYMREQYFSHFETFHKEYKICSYCNSVIPDKQLTAHETECMVTDTPFSCDKCPSMYSTEHQVLLHSAKHEELPSIPKKGKGKIILKRSYPCPLCDLRFNGKLKLQKHCNNIHGVESYRNNYCQFCDIKFDDKKEYFLHMRKMQHMSDIDPNRGYRHKCQYCDYTARYSFILKTHMNRYHLKVMPFECDLCQKKFLDKRKLKAHIDRHMGVGRRVCDICGDTLGSTTALIKHTRLHTGERPYPCHLCNVSLNSASERKFHILRKHTDKTHPCPLCMTLFHTPYCVRKHIQQVHWKRKEKFDHTKVEGLRPEHYELFRDKRMVVL